MKLTKQTIDMLQSFSGINSSIIIHEGTRIRTQDNQNKIIAYADIQDEFPQTFSIYDLGEFLGALSLVEDADLEFKDTHLTIKNDRTSLCYTYGEAEFISEAPETVNYPDADPNNVKFKLTSSDLGDVLKACSTLGLDFT